MKRKWAKPVSYGGKRSLSSIKYIVIHYTGIDGDTARNEAEYFANGNTRAAGAHFFIDQKGDIWQSVKLERTAWSVGGKKLSAAAKYHGICTNANSVSIELCDNASKDPSEAQIKATRKVVRYIRKHCKNVKGIVRHYDVTGKQCPARMVDAAKWEKFKARVDA